MPSSEPTLLAFDTAAAHCAAALLCGGRTLVRVEPMDRGQAERLFPMLSEVLAEAGIDWHHLDGIGVGTGPGNFTGIRIAVAAARGLALGLGREAVGVSGLEVLAHGAPPPVTVALPAPRGQAYVQTFERQGPGPIRLCPAEEAGTIGGLAAEQAIERLARIAASRLGTVAPRPAPVYVRAADAAPAADPPPLILP